MNVKPTCYWQQHAQVGWLGQGSCGCAPAEKWSRWAARLGLNPQPQPCCQTWGSASLGCGQNLHMLPAQPMPRAAGAEGCQVKTSFFLILHGHCAPPVVGFILGHEPVGLRLLQAMLCQAALYAPQLPLSPLSLQLWREGWTRSGRSQGFP